jgi:hypothetical protein
MKKTGSVGPIRHTTQNVEHLAGLVLFVESSPFYAGEGVQFDGSLEDIDAMVGWLEEHGPAELVREALGPLHR